MVTTQATTLAQAQKGLAAAPEDKVFRCVNGEVYRTLQDMESGLLRMTDEHYTYHCNDVKQDFSTWVRDVFGDANLAEQLRMCHARPEAARAVHDAIEKASAVGKPLIKRRA